MKIHFETRVYIYSWRQRCITVVELVLPHLCSYCYYDQPNSSPPSVIVMGKLKCEQNVNHTQIQQKISLCGAPLAQEVCVAVRTPHCIAIRSSVLPGTWRTPAAELTETTVRTAFDPLHVFHLCSLRAEPYCVLFATSKRTTHGRMHCSAFSTLL